MHAAADACQLATLRVLLDEGRASATIEAADGVTALHLAARHARADLVSYLLRSGQLAFYGLLPDQKVLTLAMLTLHAQHAALPLPIYTVLSILIIANSTVNYD